ncbi:MAG TPA: shikimate kinase [Candidatus Polarisedimenticolaceae bacterium]
MGERDVVFLVGFMGSGKSSVGRALATLLRARFEDTDALVEAAAGKPIEAIFRDEGEGRFREMEWDALRSLDGASNAVIATGGGLFLGTAQRAFVRRAGTSVWLDVPLEVARSRAGDCASRPLWRTQDPIAFRAFFERRRAAYALADLRVDASRGSAEEVASRVRLVLNC